MNEIRHPYIWERPQMADLWQVHFGGTRRQLWRVFRLVHDKQHSFVLKRQGDRRIAAQLFWQDCSFRGKKVACINSFCVKPELQGQGLGTELLEFTHEHLRKNGYSAAVLEAEDDELVWFYQYFGYKQAGSHDTFFAKAEGKAEMIEVSCEEYYRLRREYLPENGVETALNYIRYLSDMVTFFRGDDFICAVERESVPDCIELLGNLDAAGSIAGYFQRPHLHFQTPGTADRDYMMLDFAGDMPENIYLGFSAQ